jgi:hypothetical protein
MTAEHHRHTRGEKHSKAPTIYTRRIQWYPKGHPQSRAGGQARFGAMSGLNEALGRSVALLLQPCYAVPRAATCTRQHAGVIRRAAAAPTCVRGGDGGRERRGSKARDLGRECERVHPFLLKIMVAHDPQHATIPSSRFRLVAVAGGEWEGRRGAASVTLS